MASIYLVRHGQASFGSDNYDQLSPLGRRQSALLGEGLASTGVQIDAAYCGTLQRQRDTAELALQSQGRDIVPVVDGRLNEVRNDEHIQYLLPVVARQRPDIQALIEAGFSSSKQYQKIIEAVFNYWVSPDCDIAGIQTWAAYSAAVRSMLHDIMELQGGGKTVAVFTSGGTIATFVSTVLQLPGSATYAFYEPVFNCSVTQLFYSRNRVSLSYYNDCSLLRLLGAQLGEDLVTYR